MELRRSCIRIDLFKSIFCRLVFIGFISCGGGEGGKSSITPDPNTVFTITQGDYIGTSKSNSKVVFQNFDNFNLVGYVRDEIINGKSSQPFYVSVGKDDAWTTPSIMESDVRAYNVAAGKNSRGIAVWTKSEDLIRKVCYCKMFSNGSWDLTPTRMTIPNQVDEKYDSGYTNPVAGVFGQDGAIVVWLGGTHTTNRVYASWFQGGVWSTAYVLDEILELEGGFTQPSLTVTETGKALIGWFRTSRIPETVPIELKIATWNPGTNVNIGKLQSPSFTNDTLFPLITTSGDQFLSFVGPNNTRMVTSYLNGVWSPLSILGGTASPTLEGLILAQDPSSQVVAIWAERAVRDDQVQLRISKYTNGNWGAPQMFAQGPFQSAGRATSIMTLRRTSGKLDIVWQHLTLYMDVPPATPQLHLISWDTNAQSTPKPVVTHPGMVMVGMGMRSSGGLMIIWYTYKNAYENEIFKTNVN